MPINQLSLDAIAQNTDKTQAVRPHYNGYCFLGVPWSIEGLLRGGGTPEELPPKGLPKDCLPMSDRQTKQVILLFVDGFGWEQFARFFEKLPFLQRVVDQGRVSKITALFPSTTCAHVACVHSGLSPAQSGLYEWFQYEPVLDAVIAPLLFSYAGESRRNGLLDVGAEASMFFSAQTLHERLCAHGIQSLSVTPEEFTPSPFNDALCRGALSRPYATFVAGLEQVAEIATSRRDRPRYIHYYYGGIDFSSHRYGPDSPETARVIEHFFSALETHLLSSIKPDGHTLLCLVADHGHTSVNPQAAVYVNQRCPNIIEALMPTSRGIAPAGSPRDLFLHLRPECLDTWCDRLGDALMDVATVHRTLDLVNTGLFGPLPASDAFLRRVGNLIILPHPQRTVWWYEPGRFSVKNLGEHGGLSSAEMEIPFLALPL